MTKNKVFGYFNKNNYEYLEKTKKELKKDNIYTSKSKILELAIVELRKKEYEEIKQKIGELI